jgi:anti-sigma B factor antagonist
MTDESTFELHTAAAGDAIVFTVIGEVDMTTAPELAKALDAVPDTARLVVVDLGGVTFLDSSGLNALVRGRRELAASDVGFKVVVPAEGVVRRVIEITRLEDSLSLVDSLDDALV